MSGGGGGGGWRIAHKFVFLGAITYFSVFFGEGGSIMEKTV